MKFIPKLTFILFVCAACTDKPNIKEEEQRAKPEIVEIIPESTPISTEFQNGDIIFQTSLSGQSRAIQLATDSKYSHVGVIYLRGDEKLVLEAVEPVKITPLEEWIGRGDGGHFALKRLRNAEQRLTPEALDKMYTFGRSCIGKHYDLHFSWSDDRMYCSELVWKMYKIGLGIELGKQQKIADLNITHPEVSKKLRERYGKKIPLTEPVISPAAIFESDELILVQ